MQSGVKFYLSVHLSFMGSMTGIIVRKRGLRPRSMDLPRGLEGYLEGSKGQVMDICKDVCTY